MNLFLGDIGVDLDFDLGFGVRVRVRLFRSSFFSSSSSSFLLEEGMHRSWVDFNAMKRASTEEWAHETDKSGRASDENMSTRYSHRFPSSEGPVQASSMDI